MAGKFRLIMNSGPSAGMAYPLEKSEISIGRDLANDIVINDPEISRHHSRLFLQGDHYIIEDRGSTNGTSVNGQRLMGPYTLKPGELVTLGEHISLIFESARNDPDATMVSNGINQPAAVVPPPSYNPPPQPVQQPYVQKQPYSPPPMQQQPPVYNAMPQGFSGQVPVQPQMEKKGKFPVWIMVVIILLLVLLCICGAVLYFMPCSWWLPIVDIFQPGTVCPP